MRPILKLLVLVLFCSVDAPVAAQSLEAARIDARSRYQALQECLSGKNGDYLGCLSQAQEVVDTHKRYIELDPGNPQFTEQLLATTNGTHEEAKRLFARAQGLHGPTCRLSVAMYDSAARAFDALARWYSKRPEFGELASDCRVLAQLEGEAADLRDCLHQHGDRIFECGREAVTVLLEHAPYRERGGHWQLARDHFDATRTQVEATAQGLLREGDVARGERPSVSRDSYRAAATCFTILADAGIEKAANSPAASTALAMSHLLGRSADFRNCLETKGRVDLCSDTAVALLKDYHGYIDRDGQWSFAEEEFRSVERSLAECIAENRSTADGMRASRPGEAAVKAERAARCYATLVKAEIDSAANEALREKVAAQAAEDRLRARLVAPIDSDPVSALAELRELSSDLDEFGRRYGSLEAIEPLYRARIEEVVEVVVLAVPEPLASADLPSALGAVPRIEELARLRPGLVDASAVGRIDRRIRAFYQQAQDRIDEDLREADSEMAGGRYGSAAAVYHRVAKAVQEYPYVEVPPTNSFLLDILASMPLDTEALGERAREGERRAKSMEWVGRSDAALAAGRYLDAAREAQRAVGEDPSNDRARDVFEAARRKIESLTPGEISSLELAIARYRPGSLGSWIASAKKGEFGYEPVVVEGSVIQVFDTFVNLETAWENILLELEKPQYVAARSRCVAVARYDRTDTRVQVSGALKNALVFETLFLRCQ